ncbi:MAG: S24/S26 family peptidase [Bacteroidales bacterium]|nr:S24/S26 family peptidase [Bacteroidales bacterium]
MEKMVVDNDTFFADVLQVLEQGRRVTIPVKGYSMLPFIRGGKDLVVLEKAGADLKRDDIVLFHMGPAEGGRYVMHRILSVDGDAVDIMGDGVPKNHEHVRRNQILAKAVEILRGGKRPVDPYSPREIRKVRFWQRIRPVRRYLLFAYRHLPWNRSWIKESATI